MSPRDTTTGRVLEMMVIPALKRGGYQVDQQVMIGVRPGGRKHRIDAVAVKNGQRFLVSLKWQQVGGTAEQKVPFEVICLAEAVRTGQYEAAYLVLGGEGWTLREYYTSGELVKHLRDSVEVHVVNLENFIALANSGRL